jgi:hypothetical protein
MCGRGSEKLENKQKSKLRFNRTRAIILGVIAIAAVAGVAAFVTFTQYFPAVPTAVATANLVSNCGTATPGDVLTFTPATVVAGQPFAITYACTSGAAITVTNGPISKIPTEAPAIGASGMPTTLSLIAPGVTCTPTAGIALAQSTAVSIPTGTYNYCATGTSAAVTGVVSFTVAWA